MSDYVTVLSNESDSPVTKAFKLIDGEYQSSPIKNSYLHSAEQYEISGLTDLANLVQSLEGERKRFIIRGGLIDGREPSGLRRLAKAKEDSPANFEEVDCQWCLLDIDEVDIPDSFIEGQSPPIDLIKHVSQLLPDAFKVSDCWYQFSSSMGIKVGKIRVHLWYWLSKPVSNPHMRAWLSESRVDLSLFRTVQPHYTANPIFLDGAVNPWPNRSGMFNAGHDVVQVPDTFQLQVLNAKTSTVHRQVNKMGTIDPQEIVRDENTGLIIDGRESFLFKCSVQAAELTMRGQKTKPSIKELTDQTWALFSDEADLTDNKWSYDDALRKAQIRLSQLEQGTYQFKGKHDVHILQPTPTESTKPSFVDSESGAQLLDEALSDFFDSDGKPETTVLRVTMGAGKTRQAIEHLKSLMTRSFGTRVEVYVPRHDIAADWERSLTDTTPVNASVIHVQPRIGQSNSTLGGLCLRQDYVKSLQDASIGVFNNACKSGDNLCVHYSDCPYIQQFIEPDMIEKDDNVIHIMVHNYLTLPRNPLQLNPDIAIIDESFWGALFQDVTIQMSAIRSSLATDQFPRLGRILNEALQDGEPLLEVLRGHGITSAELRLIDLEALKPNVSFDPVSPKGPRRQFNTATLHRNLTNLVRILQEELAIQSRRDPERILYDPTNDSLRLTYVKDLCVPETASLLVLDATADQILMEKVLGPINFRRIDVRQRGFVTQVYDRTGSNDSWNKGEDKIDRLVDVLNVWAESGEKPLCVGHKDLIKALDVHPQLHQSVVLNNFGNLRGSNAAQECSVIFITGRNQPPSSSVDLKARALFWDDEIALQHDLAASINPQVSENIHLGLELKSYLQSDRNTSPQSGIYASSFTDVRIERLHGQLREAETTQAIARIRLVYSKYVKQVFLLSNLPVEIPVDRYVKFDELLLDRLEVELIKSKNIPLSPTGLLKMRPDLFTSIASAKQAINRSLLSTTGNLKSLPSLYKASLFTVQFKAFNNGRWNAHKHLFIAGMGFSERLEDATGIQLITGSVPLDKWKVLLEQGNPLIEGSGWGEVRDLKIADSQFELPTLKPDT